MPRGLLRAIATVLLALGVLLSAQAAPARDERTAARYRVLSITSSATLSFSGGSANSRVSGRAQLTSRSGGGATGSISARGGRITAALSAKRTEQATLAERAGPASPYVEQRCRDSKSFRARGGLVFRARPGGKLEARWALPHAAMQGCPGPSTRGPVTKMIRILPASRLNARQLSITISGSARFKSGRYTGTHRWRAVVRLARL